MSLCRSVSMQIPLYVGRQMNRYVSMQICLSVDEQICLYVYVSMSMSLCLCLYVFVSISLSMSLCLCLYVYVSMQICLYVDEQIRLYLCLQISQQTTTTTPTTPTLRYSSHVAAHSTLPTFSYWEFPLSVIHMIHYVTSKLCGMIQTPTFEQKSVWDAFAFLLHFLLEKMNKNVGNCL